MLVEEHLDRGTDFFRVLNLRKMFGVWNCAGLNGRVTVCIFFYDQIDILLSFAAGIMLIVATAVVLLVLVIGLNALTGLVAAKLNGRNADA